MSARAELQPSGRVRVVVRLGGVEHAMPLEGGRVLLREIEAAVLEADVMESRARTAGDDEGPEGGDAPSEP